MISYLLSLSPAIILICTHKTKFWIQISISIIQLYILILVIFDFISLTLLDPGKPTTNELSRKCSVCKFDKPLRCHHCTKTNKCYLKFDHWCPWVQNIVAINFYGQFIRLIFSIEINSILQLIVNITTFIQLHYNNINSTLIIQLVSCCYSTIVCVCLGCFMLKLIILHNYLLKHNMTTVEYFQTEIQRKLNKNFHWFYDHGKKQNVKEVFPKLYKIPFPVFLKPNIEDNGIYHIDYQSGIDYLIRQKSINKSDTIAPIIVNSTIQSHGPETIEMTGKIFTNL